MSGALFASVSFWVAIVYAVFVTVFFVYELLKPREKKQKPAKLIPYRPKQEKSQ